MSDLAILNVGEGDTKLSFDPKKPAERERAAKVVQDMLKRGYAILVEVGKRKGKPLYQRATAFDPKTCEYIIVGAPEEKQQQSNLEVAPEDRGDKMPKSTRKRLAAHGTPAVAVGRTAGG